MSEERKNGQRAKTIRIDGGAKHDDELPPVEKKASPPKKENAAVSPKTAQPRRAVHTDIKEVRRNARSIRTLKQIMAVLIVLLIGIIIYITYPRWSPKLEGLFDRPVRTVFNEGEAEGGNFPIEPDNTVTDVLTVKNDLLTTDPHTLTFYDVNGEMTAAYSHNFSKPIVRTAGKRVLVFDEGAYGFKLYKKGGESYSKTLPGTILTGAVSESGTAAIVTVSDKYAASVQFFDKEGKVIYNYDSTSRIMSLYLTPDGGSCYVCTFDTIGGAMRSQIRRLDLNESGEQMVSEDLTALALGCILNDSGDIMAACDTAFFIIGSDGKIKNTYTYDGELSSYSLGTSGAAVLINGSSRNSGRLMIAGSGAQETNVFRELASESPVKLVKTAGDRVILLGTEKAYAFDFTGVLTATAEIGREYTDFTYIDSALYLLGKRGIDKIKFEM